MELLITSIPAIIVATIFLCSFFHVLNVAKTKGTGENIRRAPQVPGAWPIIGHLHLLGGSDALPHKILGNLADKYGPIFTVKLGARRALVVSDSDIAKQCYTTNDKSFVDRPRSMGAEIMAYNYAAFALGPYGQYWREVRKIVMLKLLSQRQLDHLGPLRASEVRNSMRDIYAAWKKDDSGPSVGYNKVDMKQWFGSLALNVVVRMISGKRYSHGNEEGIRFQEVVRKFFELLGSFVVSDNIPYLRWLDLGGYGKEMEKTGKEMDEILQGWFEELKAKNKVSGTMPTTDGERRQVFMEVMMSTVEAASENDLPGFDKDTIIKATCSAILAAGTDTTSVSLTWALSLLLNNPKVLKKAQDELDKHVRRDKQVEESDLDNLVYLQAIIKETLRLYPPGPLSVPRESVEDCVVGGYLVPKGTRLLVNLWKIHHDPAVWPNPDEFRPERFLNNGMEIDVRGQNYNLIPFGSGRRVCPAVSLALRSLQLVLATVLHGFELERPSLEPIDMSEKFGLTNLKATPLEVLLKPRLSREVYIK